MEGEQGWKQGAELEGGQSSREKRLGLKLSGGSKERSHMQGVLEVAQVVLQMGWMRGGRGFLGEDSWVSSMRSEPGMGKEPDVGEEEQDSLHLGCGKVECLKPLETEASAGHWMYGLGRG